VLLTGARDRPDTKAEEHANKIGIEIEEKFGKALEIHLKRKLDEVNDALVMVKDPVKLKELTDESIKFDKYLTAVKGFYISGELSKVSNQISHLNSKKEKTEEEENELKQLKKQFKELDGHLAEINEKFKLFMKGDNGL
jgi:hypothetical protein